MNIAVFDIGTNSIHMLVAAIKPDLSFEVLEHEKDTTRLGDGSFESHHLNRAAVQRALEVIDQFHSVAKAHRVKKYVAVATSAVRDARNGRKFVQEVYRRTGIRIKIVSGDEEGRLIELAARSNMSVRGKKTLVVDIGGGSMELILGDGKKYYYLKSFKLGVTRLTDHFLSKDPPSRKQLKRLEKYIEKTLAKAAKKIRKWRVSAVIGTAGTMINLGSMVYERESARPLKLVHHYDMERRKLEEVHRELINLPLRKRLNYPGLDSKRADIIVAGSVLVRTLMLLLRIDRITISKKGIREGILLDFIENNRSSLLRGLNGRIPVRRK